ncbi:MAG: DUF3179 domain-containing (seleno)protein [Haloarculaceae archaeon]
MVAPSRRQFLSAVALTSVTGCIGRDGASGPTPGSREPDPDDAEPADGPKAVPTAEDRLPLPMQPGKLRESAVSGGPPKDGIPSIDDPSFVAPDAVDFLAPGDPVFGVVEDGVAKAYPQKILVQHEIVNDELAGTNVAVTYCPLTGTVQGFERGETTFGVSGRLINANLVMYDRATETWWPQMLATSIPGPWNEDPTIRSLREFRLVWTTWERWRNHSPETRVLSTETGYARNYGTDPYGSYNPRRGYYAKGRLLFPGLFSDDRFQNKTVVMGARTSDGAVAFRKESLRDGKTMAGELGGEGVLAVYDSRFDTAYVYRNPDRRSYGFDGGSLVGPDGTTHAPDSLPLSRIHTFDAMWFAWAGYYPETSVYE